MNAKELKDLSWLVLANIEMDLVDRRGLRQAWHAIDDHAVKAEIMGAWAGIIQDAIASAVETERETCAKLLDVKAAEKLKANNRDATMALMEGAKMIRAQGTR